MSGFVHVSVLVLLSIRNEKEVPGIDFIVVIHQQNVGCDLKDVSPFHLSALSALLIENRHCVRKEKEKKKGINVKPEQLSETSRLFLPTMVS